MGFDAAIERAMAVDQEAAIRQKVAGFQSDFELLVSNVERVVKGKSEVIRLAVWEELSHADIGAVLGCSPRAVTMRLSRALRRLRRETGPSIHRAPVGGLGTRGEPRG